MRVIARALAVLTGIDYGVVECDNVLRGAALWPQIETKPMKRSAIQNGSRVLREKPQIRNTEL